MINNTFSNNYNGIYLFQSEGNTIIGNNISNNIEFGINLVFSNYNTISRNRAVNNFRGLELQFIIIINETIGRDAPSFNIYVNETNLDVIWYTVDSGANNVTFTENGTIDKFLWESLWDTLNDGDFIKLKFYANDTSGNLGWGEVSVIKFEILPAFSGFSNTKLKQKEGDKNVDSEVDSFIIGFIIVVSVSGLIFALSFIRKRLKKIVSKVN